MEKKDLPNLTKNSLYVLYWTDGNVSKLNFSGEQNGFYLFKKGDITVPVRLSSLKNIVEASK